MTSTPSKLHIAMFPWLAFGHIIPYLELAKLLSQNGHSISFISTPKNLLRLPKLPHHPLISLVPLPLPAVSGLPSSAEATSDISHHLVPLLKIAYDLLQPSLSIFLESSSVDFLFFDFAAHWAPSLAASLRIGSVFFSIIIASALVYVGPSGPLIGDEQGENTKIYIRNTVEDLVTRPKWVPFEEWNVMFRHFEASKVLEFLTEPGASGISDLGRFGRTLKDCSIVAVRSSYEMEDRELRLLEKMHGKPVVPVGQLPPDVSVDVEDLTGTWRSAKEWLDGREIGSVVYVAFGSEAIFEPKELAELALGLEMSGFSFFWVLRAQQDQLPEAFEDRTSKRGIIWTSWAPQLKILRHESIVAMLSHSGWSSVVEALSLEKPLVLFTMFADQGLNAKVLEGRKMAYVIPREERDGSFTKEAVAESLKVVVEGEEGEVYRENAKEMGAVIGDKERQRVYTEKLVEFLQAYKTMNVPMLGDE